MAGGGGCRLAPAASGLAADALRSQGDQAGPCLHVSAVRSGVTLLAADMLALDLHTVLGIIGSIIVIVAYFATQAGKLRADDPRFAMANIAGAVLIMVSLFADWNLPAFIMEVFWLL